MRTKQLVFDFDIMEHIRHLGNEFAHIIVNKPERAIVVELRSGDGVTLSSLARVLFRMSVKCGINLSDYKIMILSEGGQPHSTFTPVKQVITISEKTAQNIAFMHNGGIKIAHKSST